MENIDKAVLSIVAWFVYIVCCGDIIMKDGVDAASSGLTFGCSHSDTGLLRQPNFSAVNR